MSIANALSKAGLRATGTPPTVTVEVGSESVAVRIEESGTGLLLRAGVAVAGISADADLSALSRAARGDTWFSAEGSELVGTRTLVDASPGDLYDSVHEIAKETLSAARVAGIAAGAVPPAPAQEPAVAAPTTGPPAAAGGFRPTHSVRPGGAPARATADPAAPVAATLAAGLPLELVQEVGGWAQVRASNGWTGWIDARTILPGA